jgi:hypothetical protein
MLGPLSLDSSKINRPAFVEVFRSEIFWETLTSYDSADEVRRHFEV